jgi:hypothetical protein
MLYETERAHRRLFREGDTSYPGRRGKIVPNQYDIPQAYWPLLQWYHETYNQEPAKCPQARPSVQLHPLHELHTLRDLANYLRQLDHDIEVEEPCDPRDQALFICATCEGEIYVSQPDPNISVGEDFYNLVRLDPRLLAPCNEGEDWMLLSFPLNEFNP